MELAVKFLDTHLGVVANKQAQATRDAPSRQSGNGSALGKSPNLLNYKAKMKGVALAFNVHEPAGETLGANYKFKLN